MILKDISLASPQENILYDDLLLQQAEEGDEEFLRFWESPTHFIVLGRTCKEEDDLKIEQITKNGMPVLRRSSGGGTVIQGQGCLNYSLILSKEKTPEIADLRKSYAFILNKIVQALKNIDRECTFLPISDIAMVQNQKNQLISKRFWNQPL
jgi:lipoate-protein ligase A